MNLENFGPYSTLFADSGNTEPNRATTAQENSLIGLRLFLILDVGVPELSKYRVITV
jgi:hypothetical protein